MTPEQQTKAAIDAAKDALDHAYSMAYQDIKAKVTSYSVGKVLNHISHALERIEECLELLAKTDKSDPSDPK